jgi:hypothetical protein
VRQTAHAGGADEAVLATTQSEDTIAIADD